ncbi:MAG: PQQ-binding-like beta-propeller repeat protein [Candidatus Micrarchaeia archaeon]
MMQSSSRAVFFILVFALLAQCAHAGRVKWSSDYGADVTGGIDTDGTSIYIGALDTVSKAQALDGRSLWSVQAKGSLLRPFRSGGLIIALSREGQLYEISDTTRMIVKTVNLSGEVLNDPLVSGTNVYIPTENGIVLFSTSSGTVLWQQKQPCKVHSTPVLAGGRLFAFCENGGVLTINTADGSVADQAQFSTVFWKSSPVVLGNRIFMGTYDGKIYSFATSSPKNAMLLASTPDGAAVSADLAADNEAIIFTTAGGHVCRMQQMGAIDWCTKLTSQVAARPIITEGGIYAITDGGILYGISHGGKLLWDYQTGLPIKAEIIKQGGMIYAISKNGTLAALSTSSCDINFPAEGDDVSGVDSLDVEISAYADTPIREVQVRVNDGGWITATGKESAYVGQVSTSVMALGENTIYCRVVSGDGEEREPYSAVNVVRKAAGREMNVKMPSWAGYKTKVSIAVSDASGKPLDHVSIMLGKTKYTNVNGTLEVVPAERGDYHVEVRRPGYKPFTGTITVGDDYTPIIVMFMLVALLIAVFYISYKKWMEE